MQIKLKRHHSSSKTWLEQLFGPRVGKRVASKPSEEFRRLRPAELKRLNISQKSERYVERSVSRLTKKTPTLSKRQLYQKKLSETSGRPVTLERRAREYLSGDRQAATALQAALRARALEASALRKKYKGERVPRIRQHLRSLESKAQGEHLDWEV
jgi:hypothetical protein